MIDWSTCPSVESDPGRVSGAWVFRGLRVPVAALDGRKIAIVVILTTSWPRTQADLQPVLEAIDSATPGAYREVKVAAVGSE